MLPKPRWTGTGGMVFPYGREGATVGAPWRPARRRMGLIPAWSANGSSASILENRVEHDRGRELDCER